MKDFSGVFTALITPFKNGEIDWISLRRLIGAQVAGGINGLVICGTTAESPTLTDREKYQLFDFVKSEVSGQIPLVMGTGTNCTASTIEATRMAEKHGADAALVVVPYYNKPPQRGLFHHYQKIAECSSLPVILYNVPSRTITKLELETIQELSRLPNIIGIKEATGDLDFGRRIAESCGREFLLTSGDDGSFLNLIGVGAKGVISVASNIIPGRFADWCSRARKGDISVMDEFEKFVSLNNFLYVEANPIPVKMAAYLMGLVDSPELRLPLLTLSEPHKIELKNKLQVAGLL